MGDWFQTMADVHAGQQAAEPTAAHALDWLITSGIIEREQTDCVFGRPLGHQPGARA